ncbi:hypothetical protein [Andreprevotia chitinilytica]|uniref:hypothetical protein n=1 Tax=Andreprevotia chitinilytica TaxID=396808 RepID=UPI000553279B|nr:hypothetical protein [Andreprevotia chitinilytica]
MTMRKSVRKLIVAAPFFFQALAAYAAVPATSAFNTDPVEVHVAERSAEAFAQINEILCYIAQTKYDAFVNKGPYRALVDSNPCKSNKDDPNAAAASSQDQTSGSNSPNYMTWTLNVTRADNASPEAIDFWVSGAGGGNGSKMKIQAHMVVSAGASASNPLGLFKLDYIGYPVVGGVVGTTSVMQGYMAVTLQGGKPQLAFYDTSSNNGNGGGPQVQRVVLDRSADGTTGDGTTVEGDGTQFTFAFDSNFFHRKSGASDVCYSRTAFDQTAWSYGLYDSVTGDRIVRNSGFPISVTKNGNTLHGYVGYWGLWLPDGSTLSNGDTVTRESQNGSAGVPYTLFEAGGRLTLHTRKQVTLGSIAGIPLNWQTMGQNNTPGTQFEVHWDSAQHAFIKTRQMQQQQGGTMQWIDINPPVALTSSDFGTQQDFQAFSQSLGGDVRIALFNPDHSQATFSDTSAVQLVLQTLVRPDDATPPPATLRCYESCPDTTQLTAANPYHAPGTPNNYTFDLSSMLLKEGSTPVLMTTNSATQFQFGLQTGLLFDPTPTNLNLLKCDWNPAETCSWKAWQALDHFYTWETGPNSWNQLTLLKDGSGNFLKFDSPLEVVFSYLASSVSLGSSDLLTKVPYKDGSSFRLEYAGFGQLQGIPGICFDPLSNKPTACGPGTRWLPQFSLNDGSVLQDATDNTKSYLSKALAKEERMQKQPDLTNCATLTLPTSLVLPDQTGLSTPTGTEPAVTAAPAVIGGVLQ